MPPTYHEFGPIQWVFRHGRTMLKEGWFSAYYMNGEIHACVSRLLYALSATYRAYVERLWAHEYGHSLGFGHSLDENDIMGARLGDNLRGLAKMRDTRDVMRRSARWRDTIRTGR